MELKSRTNQPVQGDEIENLKVTGDLQAFENITDADGHKRFIEGDLEVEPFNSRVVEYAKWSLSGTHLMLVVCISLANAEVVTSGQVVTILNDQLPQWVLDKLYPIFGDIVSSTTLDFRNTDYSSQNVSCYLQKTSSGTVRIIMGSITLNKDRTARIAFDLLIDNE